MKKTLPEKTNYSKLEIFEYLSGINKNEVRFVMNEVISKNRKLPYDLAKHKTVLYPSEAMEVLEHYK